MTPTRRAALITLATALGAPVLLAQSTVPVAPQFQTLHFRSIGPAIMSGRIADIAVYEKNTSIWYVGAAHGGVWKTTSNGAQFTPLFEKHGLMSIGDVTVSQSNPDVVWVGTGESNNRQSTSWGDGVWKSTDGGKTFTNVGLAKSEHIGRIVIDPSDDNVVLVAATGPLFGPGGDRGVYKTTDGGKTWKRVLYVDENTGASDLVMSYTDPKTLYASTYQRRRTDCCVNGGGPGSGIWKSTDGGDTWTRLANGLPSGPLGRIGLDTYRRNGNIVYASIEAPTPAGQRGGGAPGAAGGESGLYRSDDGGATWKKTNAGNPRPLYFSQVRVDPNDADRVFMGGVKMSLTIDAGKTTEGQASLAAHDDVHAIWIDPSNSEHMLIGDDGGVSASYDGAKTWNFFANLPVGLFYHVGYDMKTPYGVCGGMQDNYDWCGPSASRQQNGILNHEWIQIQGGDGFVAVPDIRDPRWVYSETQDGNIIRRNIVTGESKSIRPNPMNVFPAPTTGETYRWNWDTPMIVSPNDPGTLLVAANRVFVSHDRGDSWTAISPDLTTNANRDTIVTMGVKGADIRLSKDDGISQWPAIVTLAESPKLKGVLYTGSEDGLVYVSRDNGAHWTNITKNIPGFPDGGYVSKVAPSRYAAGTVYVTVDNHRLNDFAPYMWVSTDYGQTFHSIVNNLAGENVRTLTEDQKNRDVLYIGTETGLFLSLDRGAHWQRLDANFPNVRVDEITLHPRDNAMLIATHGRALWVLDHLEPIQEYAAAQASSANVKLFTVPAALEWKPKDDRNDEFWGHQYFVGENPPFEAMIQYLVKDPVSSMQLRVTDAAGHVVRVDTIAKPKLQAGIQTVCWDMRGAPIVEPAPDSAAGGRGGAAGGRARGPAVPGVPQPVPTPYTAMNPCLAQPDSGAPTRGGGFGRGGALGGPAPYALPGTYTVALVSDGKVLDSKALKVIGDPDVHLTTAQAAAYNALLDDLHAMQRRAVVTASALNALYRQMADVSKKVTESSAVPATVKAQFTAFSKQLDAVREKFGVPLPAPGGRGGGGRGAAPDPANVLARESALKNSLMGVWEVPSASSVRQYNAIKTAMPRALADANAVLARAATVSKSLASYGITMTVPPIK
ncbi:MAG TPA: hypothetical protein VHB25_18400 [Gemmatimonadaceae bacterium]|nr:hypothetical protein [Gemmatimonadaceae bacterium]